MSDRDCRAELCPMWDGESCPCQAFGLDPYDPPTGGVFETVTPTGDAVTRARELLDKATPGPWEITHDRMGVMGSPQEAITTVIPTVVEFALREHDAELIAAAPTLLAGLADEVERLTPVCSGCRLEPEADCPAHGYSRAELWAEFERLTSENGDLFDYACVCVGGELDLTCPVHTDGEDVVSASERISELADEVNRLRAALHLRDTTPRPPENAMWHWSLISNSDYTKVCAENARLRERLDAVMAIHSYRNGDRAECEMSTGQGVSWPCWTYKAALGVES